MKQRIWMVYFGDTESLVAVGVSDAFEDHIRVGKNTIENTIKAEYIADALNKHERQMDKYRAIFQGVRA